MARSPPPSVSDRVALARTAALAPTASAREATARVGELGRARRTRNARLQQVLCLQHSWRFARASLDRRIGGPGGSLARPFDRVPDWVARRVSPSVRTARARRARGGPCRASVVLRAKETASRCRAARVTEPVPTRRTAKACSPSHAPIRWAARSRGPSPGRRRERAPRGWLEREPARSPVAIRTRCSARAHLVERRAARSACRRGSPPPPRCRHADRIRSELERRWPAPPNLDCRSWAGRRNRAA